MNKFLTKLKNGKTAIGTHAQLGSPVMMEIMGMAGFDAVWIDTEHTAIDKQDLLHSVIALNGYGAAAIVRIPWNDPVLAKPVLEMGVDGMIFPYVRSADEVRTAMEACLYPPLGCRGFGPIRANRYGMMGSEEYLNGYIDRTFRIAQIEHIDAVEQIGEIVQVEHLSGIVLGPNDLSGSLGLLTQTSHPDVQRCFDLVAKAAHRANLPFGVSTGYGAGQAGAAMRQWLDRGANFVFVGSDIAYAASGAAQTFADMAGIFG
ncbi:MAG: 4-hydroxy-3-methylbut-2-en-1-yl diphosphate synthase [Clostridiaceae bacterium]|nr:4-hydroxy-3-methylbut-2-en-1-yl diphosphate synthase [Clostridiaceae bacterium]NBH78262.1 4-hydroxy-3-methylbut-2-en-1-yl diphosphate synthase [Clostridiaceae bacterium]NBI81604.1 4-hydroxy-3-methylbut-2-en-1-yl diphosphate synthase [Clostridiaceae bacterium]